MTRKTNNPQTEKPRRRRRKPEAAEAEILHAAENFLREHPFREMTVDDVMSRTGLSRPSFYEYFRDRHHLIMKLTERLAERNGAISEIWFRGSESIEDLRRAIRGIVEFYVTHGHLLRALSDAATNDRKVEHNYRRMVTTIIDGTAKRIREELARGTIKGLDAAETATALILMNERYLIEKLGRHPQADPELVAGALMTIWQRVLYCA